MNPKSTRDEQTSTHTKRFARRINEIRVSLAGHTWFVDWKKTNSAWTKYKTNASPHVIISTSLTDGLKRTAHGPKKQGNLRKKQETDIKGKKRLPNVVSAKTSTQDGKGKNR